MDLQELFQVEDFFFLVQVPSVTHTCRADHRLLSHCPLKCAACTLERQYIPRSTTVKHDHIPGRRRAVSSPQPPLTLTFTASTRVYLPTDVRLQDDLYPFPRLEICFWEGQGCDERLCPSVCANSAHAEVFYPPNIRNEGVQVPSKVRVRKYISV